MNRTALILTLVCVLPVLTGCDFFRKLAGRPTSEDIAARRLAIERFEESARQDSIKLAREASAADSLLTAANESGELRKAELAPGNGMKARYCVAVGSFRNVENAQKLAAVAEKAGYPAVLMTFRSGLTGVGLNPTDDIREVFAALARIREESFAPKDAFVIDSTK